jgi:coproporphyrinogen III oxidase-like Fe-S oxidoreductase
MQSVEDLSEEARIAYRAFLDMSNSKAAHFNRLEAIDTLYTSGGVPSITEKLELERLLADHDKNVLAFKTAMAAVDRKSVV